MDFKLKPVQAFTLSSDDNEYSSSIKGVFKDYNIAVVKAKGSGWYGSDGEVREAFDIFEDENGNLYRVTQVGDFVDINEKYKEDTIASIKTKLSKEELTLLGIK